VIGAFRSLIGLVTAASVGTSDFNQPSKQVQDLPDPLAWSRKELIMQQQSRLWGRAALALGAALVVFAIGTSVGRPSALASNRSGVPAAQTTETPASIAQAIGDRSVMAPVSWCCSGTSPSGVTVTGQASVKGQGKDARDSAITQAVADATDQAETAANAAGITLGKIVDIQVSSSGYPYPMTAAGSAGAEGSAGASGTFVCRPGGCSESGGGVACPGTAACVPTAIACGDSAPCPTTIAPAPVETFASVTITWAIGWLLSSRCWLRSFRTLRRGHEVRADGLYVHPDVDLGRLDAS
jgi:hypothetical protein